MLTKKNLLLAISIFLSLNLFCQNASIPGIDIIGKSYNIFGEYANANSLKSYRIFDFSKVPTYSDNNGFTLPNIIILENISDHKSKSIEGTSASEYIQKLSANAGLQVNAFVFKGSFDASFNQNNSGSSYNYFYSILDENYKWRISLETRDVDYLISILDPLFVKDIQTLSPADFFKRYGSHIVVKGYLGGRAEFSMKSNATEQTVQKDLKMQLDARYVNVKAQGNLNTNSSNFTQNSNTQTQTRIIGGNSEYANNIENPTMYQKWVEGIKSAPVLCDFDEESLMPIWLLTKNLDRQKILEDYFNNVIVKQNQFEIKPGIYKNYVLDDFSTPYSYKNGEKELFWYSDQNHILLTRDFKNKELDILLIDGQNTIVPLMFTNITKIDSFPQYINFSKNLNYYFEIKNNSDNIIYVHFIIIDKNNKIINADASFRNNLNKNGNDFLNIVKLMPNEVKIVTKGTLNYKNIALSGNFFNGLNYDVSGEKNEFIKTHFDFNPEEVRSFIFYFISPSDINDPLNVTKANPINNCLISIKNFKIGL